ncbi:hypothetical protein B0H14DRAFT_3493296 [Mycena olivaceomarginata]|nr:hypothetical protein B0H14DRAFT_3493296 [Mycena olivaceomarginata]
MKDIVTLLVQAAGGSIAAAATTPDRAQLGAHIMLGGIIFQFAAMVAYCALATEFLARYAKTVPSDSTFEQGIDPSFSQGPSA